MQRSIELVIAPPVYHWVGNGFRVHNFIPTVPQLSMERMNPFILLDYHSKFYYEPTNELRGVGAHPHRGIETVTISYSGSIAHNDSSGSGGVIKSGDVQWMTAGNGILHKEFHEQSWANHGGIMHMVQLWVNLSPLAKQSPAKYQAIINGEIPKYVEDKYVVEVISGKFKGITGAAETFSVINLYNIKMQKDAKIEFNLPATYNTGLLIIAGDALVNGQKIATDNFVLMANDGENFTIETPVDSDAIILLMSGEPIDGAIVARGPFVMNTKEEILEAYNDFYAGKYGYLE